MDGKKRKILGAAALSALTLFTGCKAKDLEQKPEPILETKTLNLCDTSEINAQTMYDKYVENFEAGNSTYINSEIEALINEKYVMLREENEIEPTTDEWGLEVKSPIITYNFDGSEIDCDSNEHGNYFVGEELVKSIGNDFVKIKTKDGYFKINYDYKEDSYTINNVDEKNSVSTKIVYNIVDKSSTIEENIKDDSLKLEFNGDGTIKSAEGKDDKGITTIRQFDGGNVNVYKMYDGHENLIEEHMKDGSYYVQDYYNLDKERYNYDVWVPAGGTYVYNYDKNDNLKYVEMTAENMTNDGERVTYEAKLMPNGDTYSEEKYYNSNGTVRLSKKEEYIYKEKQENTITKEVDDDGVTHTKIIKYDRKLVPKSAITSGNTAIGDCVYHSEDNKIYKQQKDGIIYVYSGSYDEFLEAYKVEDGVLTYFDEQGRKTKTLNANKKEVVYDENGKITEINNRRTHTKYYDYDVGLIKSISNLTDGTISVKGNNDQRIELGSKGSILYYEDGRTREYNKDANSKILYYEDGREYHYDEDGMTGYNKDGIIIQINKNGIRETYYDDGAIESRDEDGIYTAYTQDGYLKVIKNEGHEDTIYQDGYALDKGSRIEYYPDGTISKYYHDENNYVFNYEDGSEREVVMDDQKVEYGRNHKIYAITTNWSDNENRVRTQYWDYEKGLVSQIIEHGVSKGYYQNQSIESISVVDSDTSITVYDNENNEYTLNYNDEIDYYINGSTKHIKQGPVRRYYHRDFGNYDSNIYHEENYENHVWTLYQDGQVLYQADFDAMKGIIVVSQREEDGVMKIRLSNGDVVEALCREQNQEEQDEER